MKSGRHTRNTAPIVRIFSSRAKRFSGWLARVLFGLVLFCFMAGLSAPAVYAQAGTTAQDILTTMTPEEKVGQLFLVNFTGTDVSEQTQIYDLIARQHVGGVVLTRANDNFTDEDTSASARDLINMLQQVEYLSSQNSTEASASHAYIPLFVGVSQEGGGIPNDQILDKLASIPNQMAIGATWDAALAEQAGSLMGDSLSSLGFNLYLGLSMDVLTLPDPALSVDMTTRVFGGDPYWVGQMAGAYISGLHGGSNGRMAVIAKHFPGRGSSDRPMNLEIPTIRRSLDELKSMDLAPFFAVTGDPANPATIDGLLVSHIRYQGLQGNIRATTRPISFDQQALGQILGLASLDSWRSAGGLIVSDDLGTTAVRKFYDPDLKSFSARLVARDAFLAGNDMLYMGNIVSSDASDTFTSVQRTLEFFAQRYQEDPAFASLVDASVLRILNTKLHVYGSFNLKNMEYQSSGADVPGLASDPIFSIARQSATLISPSAADLVTVLPEPPNVYDYLVFLTDVRMQRQCSTCTENPVLSQDAMEMAVRQLYGPQASGLVTSSHLSSFSFDDLRSFLDGQQDSPDLANAIGRASWVIISTLDLPEGSAQLDTLKRLLSEKQSLLSTKKVILFSFSAPYFLDSTDISKLTAFYGMYDRSDPFVNVAVRLLFQEIAPLGSLPVSVPGIGYDLISATTPDPKQVISLSLDQPKNAPTPAPDSLPGTLPAATQVPTLTLEPTAEALFGVGDTISLRTGVILDHNQRPVPDGTPVRFTLSQGESDLVQQVESVTSQGVAVAAFRLDRPGLIEIRAASEPARVSDTIQLNVTREGATIIIITPTVNPVTPEPTSTPAPPTPTPIPSPLVSNKGYPTFWGWSMVVLMLAAGVLLTYWLASQMVDSRWAVRWALLVLVGGLIFYNYLALGFPWGELWLDGRGLPAFLQAILIGEGVGFAVGWFWRLAAESGEQTHQQ